MATYGELSEAYLRADQEWRIAVAKAHLDHADLAPDLRAAQADLDCEELLRDRLEKLVALEAARAAHEEAMAAAARQAAIFYALVSAPGQGFAEPKGEPADG